MISLCNLQYWIKKEYKTPSNRSTKILENDLKCYVSKAHMNFKMENRDSTSFLETSLKSIKRQWLEDNQDFFKIA